ncbi:MAG: DinB family protein [Acidimicrobiia bacterium]|nr:DinB family protein [Acidimicrobiia bacterium]
MAEFVEQDLRGSRFHHVDLSGSRFRDVGLRDVKIADSHVDGLDISGYVDSLVVNGVEVAGYVEEELNRRHPERAMLRPESAQVARDAWSMVQERAAATLERARALPPALLDASVDEEFSYLETLRHLVFAVDRWITGPVLGEVPWFHPLGVAYDGASDEELAGLDPDAHPTIDEVLAVRADRASRVTAVLAGATDEDVARVVDSPNGGTATVLQCVGVVLREEWQHDQYAVRDLAVLEAQAEAQPD